MRSWTFHQTTHVLGHSGLEVICYVVVWALQLLIIQNGMDTVRKFQDWAGPAVWVAMLVLAIGLCVKAGGFSFDHGIPTGRAAREDQRRGRQRRAGLVLGADGGRRHLGHLLRGAVPQLLRLLALRQGQGRRCRKGNLWGLPVNLILFSLVAGITTIAAFKVYGEVLLHPEQISAKFDSWLLALLAALTFAVATLGINVVANFVSPAFDFANVFPAHHRLQEGRLHRRGHCAGALSVRALGRQCGALRQRDRRHDGAAAGHHPGRLLPDRQGRRSMCRRCTRSTASTATKGGWNVNALVATAVGSVFSSILPNFTSLLPSWWGTYGWFFGVAIGGVVYYALSAVRPRVVTAPGARA